MNGSGGWAALPANGPPTPSFISGETPFAVEVECVQKTDERYKDIFWRYQGEPEIAACLYVAEESLLNALIDHAKDFPTIYFTTKTELFEKKEKTVFRNSSGRILVIEENLEKNLK